MTSDDGSGVMRTDGIRVGENVGRNHNFYVETRCTGVWNRPEVFAQEEQPSYSHKQYGEFTWISRHVDTASLFFGEQAMFKFRRERPPETEHSALFQYLDSWYDYREFQLSWIPYEELPVDLWGEPSFVMEAEVAPQHALFFADGNQMFPEQAFIEAGLDKYRIAAIRQGRIVAQTIDRLTGRGRFELRECPPDRLLAVTWKDSVRGQIGDWCAEAFLSLRQFGNDDQLRVVSLFQ